MPIYKHLFIYLLWKKKLTGPAEAVYIKFMKQKRGKCAIRSRMYHLEVWGAVSPPEGVLGSEAPSKIYLAYLRYWFKM